MVWEIWPWPSAKPVIKQRTDALPSGLFLLVCTLTSIKALQPGKITSLKPSPAAANCYENTQAVGVWRDGGGMEGSLMIQRSVRDTESVLSVLPSRNTLPINESLDGECHLIGVTNCRYLLWLWVRVSGGLPALLSGSQGFDWLLHLTMHNPRDQLLSPAAAALHQWRRVHAPKVPPFGVFVQWWWLCAVYVQQQFFFLPISLCNEMMNDVVSPNRRATHTNLLPGI